MMFLMKHYVQRAMDRRMSGLTYPVECGGLSKEVSQQDTGLCYGN